MSALPTTTLADVTAGFADVVHGSQRTYRALLAAMAHPGTVVRIPPDATAGLEPPGRLSVGIAAVLLTLVDAEADVVPLGRFADAATRAWLRFHTGVRLAHGVESAGFVMVHGEDCDEAIWSRLGLGSDEAPQDGATLIVDVDGLTVGTETAAVPLRLRGPGIERETRLDVSSIDPAFWQWRTDLQRSAPRGIDLILVDGDRIAALPRSTRIALRGSR